MADRSVDLGQLGRIKDELSSELPATWLCTTLGDAFIWGSGGTPKKGNQQHYGGDIPWLIIGDLNDGTVNNSETKITELGLKNSSAKLVEPGSLLLAMYGSIGKLGIAGKLLATNQAIAFARPNEISTLYLFYFLRYVRNRLVGLGKGATQQNISQTVIKAFPFVLAPISQQHRIVAKIEELFSELDKGIESLKTAREQLKIYRQAVLKHAFEGKLTAQWREENKDKFETADQLLVRVQKEREARYQQQLEVWEASIKTWEKERKLGKKPSKPRALKKLRVISDANLVDLPELPESWRWEKLGWMTCGVEYGTAAKSSDSGSVPVVRMGNIQNAKIDWADLVYTSDQTEIARYSLSTGDVLFNRTNSPELVGKSAIYRGDRPALFAGYLIRANHIQTIVHSQYLNLFLNSHIAKQHGNKVKTDGVNQSNINGEKLSNYPFPYSSFAEQCEVVRILGEKLSIVDQMEGETKQQLQIAETLRQSILKKAYSGQLVSQDSNDELASVLLERIRTEKAVQSRVTKKSKPKTNQKVRSQA